MVDFIPTQYSCQPYHLVGNWKTRKRAGTESGNGNHKRSSPGRWRVRLHK